MAIFGLWLATVQNSRLVKKIKEQERYAAFMEAETERLNATRRSLIDLCAECNPDNIKYKVEEDRFGFAKVCKEVDGLSAVIKLFYDKDKDFNMREAQDLCDKLNEK